MRIQLNFIVIAVIFYNMHSADAQSVLSPTGNNVYNNSGSVTYTVGQIDYIYTSSAEGSVSLGIQQAFEISEVVSVHEVPFEHNVKIFPNPTSDIVHIEVEVHEIVFTQLRNIQGKIVIEKTYTNPSSTIDVSELPPGSYLLNVSLQNNQSRTYKIIKK